MFYVLETPFDLLLRRTAPNAPSPANMNQAAAGSGTGAGGEIDGVNRANVVSAMNVVSAFTGRIEPVTAKSVSFPELFNANAKSKIVSLPGAGGALTMSTVAELSSVIPLISSGAESN